MNIQWYPGHMTRAKRSMQEDVRAVDLIIEIVDARAPLATRNPHIEALGKGKFRIILLNKADLAEDPVSFDWVRYFKAQGYDCFFMDGRSKKNLKRLMVLIERVCAEKRERDKKRGILNRPLRAMVAGIPNVGKSTLINTIAGKSTAKTGNKPGVTKGNQWIRLNKSVELLDTPGILWPKFEDPRTGEVIAFLGSVNEMIVDPVELAVTFIGFLRETGKTEGLYERCECTDEMTPGEILESFAVRRGCLQAGGAPDLEKAAAILMNEYRSGRFGQISLEVPPAAEKASESTRTDENTEKRAGTGEKAGEAAEKSSRETAEDVQ